MFVIVDAVCSDEDWSSDEDDDDDEWGGGGGGGRRWKGTSSSSLVLDAKEEEVKEEEDESDEYMGFGLFADVDIMDNERMSESLQSSFESEPAEVR